MNLKDEYIHGLDLKGVVKRLYFATAADSTNTPAIAKNDLVYQLADKGETKIPITVPAITLGNTALHIGSTYTEISGPLAVWTSASSDNAFTVGRSGYTEAVKHWVDDSAYHIDYTNDETASSIIFKLQNTDTESGGGANASTNTITFASNGYITANGFIKNGSDKDHLLLGNGDHIAITKTVNSSSTDSLIPTAKSVYSAINAGFAANDAMIYKGTYTAQSASTTTVTNSGFSTAPGSDSIGWTWVVSGSGYFGNIAVEPGDMIIAKVENPGTTVTNYNVVQTNLVEALVKDNTGGTDSGYTRYVLYNTTNNKLYITQNSDAATLEGTTKSGLFTAFSGGVISSSSNTLTQTNHSITIGGTTRTAGSSECSIVNSNTIGLVSTNNKLGIVGAVNGVEATVHSDSALEVDIINSLKLGIGSENNTLAIKGSANGITAAADTSLSCNIINSNKLGITSSVNTMTIKGSVNGITATADTLLSASIVNSNNLNIASSGNTMTIAGAVNGVSATAPSGKYLSADIINSLSVSKLSSTEAVNLTAAITINGKASSDKTLANLFASYLTTHACTTLDVNQTYFYVDYAGGSNSVATKPSSVDAFGCMHLRTADGWYSEILVSSNTAAGIYYRSASSLTSSIAWLRLLDTGNLGYTTSGSNRAVLQDSASGKLYVTQDTNADTLDNYHASGLFEQFKNYDSTSGATTHIGNKQTNIYAKIGGTEKYFVVNWSTYSNYSNHLVATDNRGADRAPNYYESKNISGFFNASISNANPTWNSGIDVLGWDNASYVAWQLIGPATSSIGTSDALYWREGLNDSWLAVRKIIDTGNMGTLFTEFVNSTTGNSATTVNITVGGTLKKLTVNYSTYSGYTNNVLKSAGILYNSSVNTTTYYQTDVPSNSTASTTATGTWRVIVERMKNTLDASKNSTVTAELSYLSYTSSASANTLVYRDSNADTSLRRLTLTMADGTAPMTVTSKTKVSNLNVDYLDGYDSSQYLFWTVYNYDLGCLVTTDITANSQKMITVKIIGNSYSSSKLPIDSVAQIYNYTSDNPWVNPSLLHLGYDFGKITFFVIGGVVKLWFKQPANYMTFKIYVGTYNDGINHITSVTNSAIPTSYTSTSEISPSNNLTTKNLGYTSSGFNRAVLLDSTTGYLYVAQNANADTLDGYHLSDLYWADLKVATASSNTTTPRFGEVGINAAASSTYILNVGGTTYTSALVVGSQVHTSAASSGSEYSTTRITITPDYHTGGPWYINSKDSSSNAFLVLSYSSTECVRVRHDGYVGIGVNPSYKLDVSGTFNATNYLYYGSNGAVNCNNVAYTGISYYSSNGPSTSLGATTSDGALYSEAYSSAWAGQIAQDYRNGNLFVRGKNNGTWTDWLRIASDKNLYLVGNEVIVNASLSLKMDTWTDGATISSKESGTYIIRVSSGNIAGSGIVTIFKGTDTYNDEIPLHVSGDSTWRPYLRVSGTKLQLSCNETTATARTYVVTIKRMI